VTSREDRIKALVAEAPPFTPAQVAKLTVLLAGGSEFEAEVAAGERTRVTALDLPQVPAPAPDDTAIAEALRDRGCPRRRVLSS